MRGGYISLEYIKTAHCLMAHEIVTITIPLEWDIIYLCVPLTTVGFDDTYVSTVQDVASFIEFRCHFQVLLQAPFV